MIRVETGARHIRHTSHSTLDAAIAAAYEAQRDGTSVRITADSETIARMIASGEAYETAHGEIIDSAQRWAIEAAE